MRGFPQAARRSSSSPTCLGGGALSLLAAVATALGIFFLINRIEGHIRFVPLLAGLLLLYAGGKMLHLSPLILILVCGLLLNNPRLLEWNAWLRSMHRPRYDATLAEFKSLVAELTFAVKSVFFIMLGYWTDVREMADWRVWAIAAVMIGVDLCEQVRNPEAAARQEPAAAGMDCAARASSRCCCSLAASETGKLVGFPFGTVMVVVLATALVTGHAHRVMDATAPATEGEAEAEPEAEDTPTAGDGTPAGATAAELSATADRP